VLPAAASGYWSPAAKALYDLQKVAVDLETDIYAVDPAGWARSFGRRPLLRRLTLARRTILLKHLKTASKQLQKADLAEPDRANLEELLLMEVAVAERALRGEVEPVLRRVLGEVGLVPANLPEAVAADKLVAELLDDLCENGHLRLADLRDAIARNRLKLPDLTGPGEFVRGDALLRADARLGDELDGVYHRGEVYLRWIQRGSAAAFGTGVGRFLTKFIAMPFGAAILTVEFAKYLAHEAGKAYAFVSDLLRSDDGAAQAAEAAAPTAHGHGPVFTPGSVTAMLVLGVVFLGLIHSPPLRTLCGRGLRAVGRALRVVFMTIPRVVWRSAPLRILRTNRAIRVTVDRLGWPLTAGAGVALFLWAFGASPGRITRWGLGTFLALAAALNLPLGRRWQDWFEERLSDSWRAIRTDLIPGVVSFLVWAFRALLGAVDRWLYTVDEWFRFREGQSKPSLVLKVILGVVWFPVAYLVRFAFYLLIEPQVNPLKHFPVVTVSHKLLLPMIKPIADATGLSLGVVGGIVSGIPGVFGFIVWELKENWRLYAANRPPRVGPLALGHHGETMRGFLRPGFHSGTVPAAFRKVRAALAKADPVAMARHRETLHHVEQAVEHLIDRELLALLVRTAAWRGMSPGCGPVHLGLQRITAEVTVPELGGEAVVIEFARIDDAITMRVVERGFVPKLKLTQLEAWDKALDGLLAMAAATDDGPDWAEWVGYWDGKKS
jgi:hypothetical protein